MRADMQRDTSAMRARLSEDLEHLRVEVERTDDPQTRALYETAAEVLKGLVTAMEHHDARSEAAWKPL
ncbi:hypothetical protein [Tranquillimonas alkanivorans]|uniref:Uncharacterized protein n=1 Tax=Tranquillimonas alkanivorans TaxID=441119 RepID=A0A1I5RSW1_9RHOB|nr:hypothetical protein [Tranquillimonas alkanivorans]SFP61497.1 hypothetical protein SAMN04488047_10970 [Tranquillimonas alkanivorans]